MNADQNRHDTSRQQVSNDSSSHGSEGRKPGAALAHSLHGLRILDASRVMAGPFCGQLLGDLGADVIKVEDPRRGDETRGWGPPFVESLGGLSAYFMACNRNKRALTLDLKRPMGRDIFLQLAAQSDVVLENFRRDSVKSLGLTAQDLHAVNPRLVICSISGFGGGPVWGGKPCYDFVAQGLSGMMAMNGPKTGEPHKFGVAIADIVTGLYTAVAALAGLQARTASGHGYAVDISLLDCAVAAMANVAQAFLCTDETPQRQGNAHMQIVPYQLFKALDGWFILAVGNDDQWQRFCAAIHRQDLCHDERYRTNAYRVLHRTELIPVLAEIMSSKTCADWYVCLDKAGVPGGPVWDFAQLFASGLAQERQLRITARRPDGTPVDLIRSPLVELTSTLAPPGHGEHSDTILRDVLGFETEYIQKLRQEGVV